MIRSRNSDNSGAARAQRIRWQSAAGGPKVRTNVGSMVIGGILWNEGVFPQDGTIGPVETEPEPGPGPGRVPDAPTIVSAVGGNAEATISFEPPENNGGSDIILYTVTSSPGGFIATGTSSPIIVPYLSNNTTYTFTVVATNSVGDSVPSSDSDPITTTTPSPSAPTITGINALTTSFIVTFNPPASFDNITNYEYSLDGGTSFTPLPSPDTTSPITIPSLTPTTTYSVAIRAVNNVPETGDSSNIVSIATASQQITVNFTTPGTTTWTAPPNVRYVQYLCVGGGGGGGGTYSKIIDLGNVPVLGASDTKPSTGYWIYNGSNTSLYWGNRLYNGSNTNSSGGASTFTDPVRVTASADSANVFGYKWYGGRELVYYLLPNINGAPYPILSNSSFTAPFINAGNNKVSGGGGGGAGAQVKGSFSATSFYSVIPRTPYTVIVGDGGAGGVGGPDSETAGTKGGDSTFDVNTSEGGSGGQPSRVLTSNTDGFNNGGRGQTVEGRLLGGYGGQGAGSTGGQGLVSTGGSGGTTSLVGPVFPGGYASGGAGGAPETVATGVTTPNIGKGGAGTGATLNSFASGIKGGTGVVILKYYI